jgi:cardiolipin synthase C
MKSPWFLLLLLVGTLSSCVYPRLDGAATPSFAFDGPVDSEIGAEITEVLARHPGETGLYLLGDGLDAFASRGALIQRAEHAIDVQYYIFHDDVTGSILLKLLLEAADRGVRVRLLIDDLGSDGIDDRLAAANVHEHLEVRLFNPRARGPWTWLAKTLDLMGRPFRINHRMHNKMLTADGIAGIVGGRNVGDEYFDAAEDVNFGDLDVLAFGPVLSELGESFDEYWNSEFTEQLNGWSSFKRDAGDLDALRAALLDVAAENSDSSYARRLDGADFIQEAADDELPLTWAVTHAHSDRPRKIVASGDELAELLLIERLRNDIPTAQEELLIVSPYFIPGKAGTRALVADAARGVEVRILTNSLASTDVGAVHAGYRRYRRTLVEGGVQVYEVQPSSDFTDALYDEGLFGSKNASLHAKTFISDRRYLFVGSMNLDPRSVQLNTELGFVIDSPELAEGLIEGIEAVLAPGSSWSVTMDEDGLVWTGVEGGEPASYRKEPRTSWWQRFKCALVGWLPIEGQL